MQASDLQKLVVELRVLGFFQNLGDDEIISNFHQILGWESIDNLLELELVLASLDQSKVWNASLDVDGVTPAYGDLLQSLTTLGAFRPSSVVIQDRLVTFQCDGYTYRYQLHPGPRLDLGLLSAVNSSLWGKAQYEVCDAAGAAQKLGKLGLRDGCVSVFGSYLVLYLTPEEKSLLQARAAWTFLESLSNTGPERVLQGWLNDYSEQGMESEGWYVFQDRQYCAELERGWDREGMIFLQEHDLLTIYEANGTVRWSGELLSRRHWLTKIHPSSMDHRWYPSDLSASEWAHFFAAKPAYRASLQRKSS